MTWLNEKERRIAGFAAIAFGVVALLPLVDQGYYLSISVNIVMYVVLCTAWTLFSGPTHYISLATAAFFGIGTYTVALGIDTVPFPLLLVIAALASGLLACVVGIATLRLSGIYFVIFTLGLAELVRQVVTWLQTNFSSSLGLYVFTDFGEQHIYWMLLGLAAIVYITGWLINRSRLGFAMQIIGNDETVAKHVGKGHPFHHLRRFHRHCRGHFGTTVFLRAAAFRLQPDDLLSGGHHGAAGWNKAHLGAAAGRHSFHNPV